MPANSLMPDVGWQQPTLATHVIVELSARRGNEAWRGIVSDQGILDSQLVRGLFTLLALVSDCSRICFNKRQVKTKLSVPLDTTTMASMGKTSMY